MKVLRPLTARLTVLASSALALACVPTPEPTPAPSPPPVAIPEAATPKPEPTEVPLPDPLFQPEVVYESWLDAPVTEGGWQYQSEPNRSWASFRNIRGVELARLACQPDVPAVIITRKGRVTGDIGLRTETKDQILPVQPSRETPEDLVAVVPPTSPLLDAIALTRGRFVVETKDLPTLYLPAWAEVTRVIEDCR